MTGASRGIGLAIAETFAAAGCDLALCARNTKFLANTELADRHAVRVLVSECDVRSESSVSDFFARIGESFGRVDILVNNAGLAGPMAPVAELSLDDWRDAIDTNLTGTFLCTRAALPLMSGGAVIVNNLSVAARDVFAGESAYVAAKHGAKGFTDTLREELRERGIRVIGLYPGATDS
ncbi:MAG TPA: SDR family oxidoreductase, partial [Armatimonadota bacterium]|nr:SDR family oxidoreductase [Armatimonadota bacterium]